MKKSTARINSTEQNSTVSKDQPGINTKVRHRTLNECQILNTACQNELRGCKGSIRIYEMPINPHPWDCVYALIKELYGREKERLVAVKDMEELKACNATTREIADIALKGLFELEERMAKGHLS